MRARGGDLGGRVTRILVVLALVSACSAPALLPDLAAAEEHERNGRYDEALDSYRRAQIMCKGIRHKRTRRQTCDAAHTNAAELLERMNRWPEAAQAYENIAIDLAHDPTAAARATYRAGRIHLRLGNDVRAYELLWKTVTDYPDEQFAADALKKVVRDGRDRNAKQLYEVLLALVEALSDTLIADNLHYHLADLAEHDFHDPAAAIDHFDAIWQRYPDSGLRDDAWWHSARLLRDAGDPRGALERLEALLATREVAVGVGSYFSVWLDDAQLRVGVILRDDLREYRAAAAAFRRLAKHYPASLLLDDALYELAVTWDRAENATEACKALRKLHEDWPDSRYELELAPALRAEHGCPSAPREDG